MCKQIHYPIGSGTEGDIPSLLDTTGIRIVNLLLKLSYYRCGQVDTENKILQQMDNACKHIVLLILKVNHILLQIRK